MVPFHKLCLMILDRLFGEDTTAGIGVVLPSPWIRGPSGGWLRRLIYTSELSIHTSSSMNTRDSIALHQTKVIDCFSPKSQLLDLMLMKNKSGNSGANYQMKIAFFPKKALLALNNHPLYPCMKSDNHEAYFSLLSTPFQEQHATINAKVKDPTVLLEPIEYFIICLLRYPLASGPTVLTPLTHNQSAQGNHHRLPFNNGVEHWIRQIPYLRLLNEYFKEYIPIDKSTRANLSKGSISESIYETNALRENLPMIQMKKLFLMLICDFWLDSTLLIRQNYQLYHQHYRHSNQLLSNPLKFNTSIASNRSSSAHQFHPSPIELHVLENGYTQRSMASIQCVYLLLVHILNDPNLSNLLKIHAELAYDESQKHGSSGINMLYDMNESVYSNHTKSKRDHRSIHSHDHQSMKLLYLPEYLKTIQQPLFDMLRCIFSRIDSNAMDDSILHLAMYVWLLYIRPWKARMTYSNGMNRSPAKYSKEWRYYIASNLHFYTTLVIILLKSVSRIDYSIQTPNDQSKLDLIEKVVDALTKDDVWNDIQSLSQSFSQWYPNYLSQPGVYMNHYDSSMSSFDVDSSMDLSAGYSKESLFHTTSYALHGNNSSNDNHSSDKRLDHTVRMTELHAMKFHHVNLFPDRNVNNLETYGILNVSMNTKESGKNLIDSLALVIFRLELRKSKPIEGTFLWRCSVIFYRYVVYYLFHDGNENQEFPQVINDDICARCRSIMRKIGLICDIDVTNALNPMRTGYLQSYHSHSNQYENHDIRNPISRKLTSNGKEQLLQDEYQMDPKDRDWNGSMDSLNRPLASYEIHYLTRFFVKVSKDLNVLFDLPIDPIMNTMTWEYLAREVYRNWYNFLPLIRRSMRFNLRFLSNLWYLGGIMLTILTWLTYEELISLPWLIGYVLFVSYSIMMYA